MPESKKDFRFWAETTNALIAGDEGISVLAALNRGYELSHSQAKLYTLKDDPQPQVLFTFGFSNLKPAPSSVST